MCIKLGARDTSRWVNILTILKNLRVKGYLLLLISFSTSLVRKNLANIFFRVFIKCFLTT